MALATKKNDDSLVPSKLGQYAMLFPLKSPDPELMATVICAMKPWTKQNVEYSSRSCSHLSSVLLRGTRLMKRRHIFLRITLLRTKNLGGGQKRTSKQRPQKIGPENRTAAGFRLQWIRSNEPSACDLMWLQAKGLSSNSTSV